MKRSALCRLWARHRRGWLAGIIGLTALALAGPGLQLRRFSVSVPFQVSALLPMYRPAQPLAQSFLQALQNQASRMSQALELVLR